MMQPKVSQLPDGKAKIVQTVFEKVNSIKTPIQLVSFILAIAFGAIIFQVSPGSNLIAFVILLLPFVLLFVVVKMMQPKVSQLPDGKAKIVQTVFEKVNSIKTPIQLVSFILAI